MQVIHSVFSWFISFCGSLFVYGAIIAAVLVLIERILYHTAKHGNTEAEVSSADRTGSIAPESASPEGIVRQADESASPVESSTRRIALITGASSGLGRKLALEMDGNEPGIDEFWLIARRKDKLEELATELRHPSHIVSLDLTQTESITALEKELRKENVEIGVLINCAGLGKIGNYKTLTVEENNRMIDLNDRAAVDVTMVSIPYMKQGDRIIEICSTAGFQPLQHFSVYAAGKRFLYNYSRALRLELLPRKIPVLAVCPYWMKDTEFISTAQNVKSRSGSADPAADSPIRNFALSTKSDKAAARIMRHSRRGYAVSTPGLICTLHRFLGKLIPTETMLYIWEGFRRL